MSEIIHLENVSKTFRRGWVRRSFIQHMVSRPAILPQRTVLDKVNLTIRAGESVGIFGPNGSGKSTLLRIVAGILRPTSGTVEVSGSVATLLSWNASFLDDLDVRDNALLLGALFGMPGTVVKEKLNAMLSLAGLEDRQDDCLRTLSPGMRARLAMAVAAEAPCQAILLDEVLTVGDAQFRARFIDILEGLKQRGLAVLHVTHDLDLLHTVSDRTFLLENGRLEHLSSRDSSVRWQALHSTVVG